VLLQAEHLVSALFEQTAQSCESAAAVVVLMLVSVLIKQQGKSRNWSEGKEGEREVALSTPTVTSRCLERQSGVCREWYKTAGMLSDLPRVHLLP
jgi:hypothetical protein